ncbi:MAG: DNA mismatch repair endonuclease MutL [bacterium]|nr:DNA mismatch repair endonuclease MutL [bacterium]
MTEPIAEGKGETEAGEKGRIRLLSDALVDQIAAGEVVERPASVVKELVENAIDAGATTIRVEVRDGGAALIAVTDDGVGMTPDELPMALQRHATSKLRSAADLMRIGSFGFRGEALPAIASVSRFRIVSRARDRAEGYEILIEGGEIKSERAAGGPVGTRIEVADLFASVPARRKFLKRAGTEWGHIADWLARLALVHPELHLEIQRDDRKATVWPTCRSLRDRIAMILPDEDAAALVEVEHDTPEAKVHAFVSTPERTRPNGNALYLFVNGRPVRDRLLRGALIQAYRDLIPRGRFPVGVLYVEVPPATVDVNVHPAKWEVRFIDPQAVHRAIRHAVRDAMAKRSWLGDMSAPGKGPPVATGLGARATATTEPMFTPQRSIPTTGAAETNDWVFARGDASVDRVAETATSPPAFEAPTGGHSGSVLVVPGARSDESAPVSSFGALSILGQLRASYILAETADGLMVIDQHAAHERILYENLRKGWLERGVARQGLLTPLTVELAPSAVAAIGEAPEIVARLGFEIEPFGDDAVLVRAIPAEISGQDVGELVTELASALDDVEGGDEADENVVRWLPSLDRLFATMACHSARRFGDRLPREEQEAILAGLDTIPWAPTCPHGRPVAILLSHADLELRFRRR